jgi:DoxX-like family
MSAMALHDDSSLPPAGAQSAAELRQTSRAKLWTGRVLTALVGLFLLFDAVGKLVMAAPVVDAFHRLGFPTSLGVGVGVLLLVCTALYLIPRTAVLGAVLLSAFLGGAVAIQMRAGSPTFETIFPVLFAILAWAGVYLRERRLAALLPLRR